MAKPDPSAQLTIVARSPFNIYFEGQGYVLSATNKVGQFDVLPGHADFFSVLEPGEVIVQTEKGPVNFAIENGILTVRDDTVYLFADV